MDVAANSAVGGIHPSPLNVAERISPVLADVTKFISPLTGPLLEGVNVILTEPDDPAGRVRSEERSVEKSAELLLIELISRSVSPLLA